MGKETFVDASLVNIRGKLQASSTSENTLDETGKSSQNAISPTSALKSPVSSDKGIVIPDKEWKKALFARWDEYKATRRDVLVRLHSRISRIPEELRSYESAAATLNSAEVKLKTICEDLEALDDSNWNRSNFSSELGMAMKKVEDARLESIVLEAALKTQTSHEAQTQIRGGERNASFIHELTSISFIQAFKLGLGFFFSLILAILLGTFLLALFNYLTVN